MVFIRPMTQVNKYDSYDPTRTELTFITKYELLLKLSFRSMGHVVMVNSTIYTNTNVTASWKAIRGRYAAGTHIAFVHRYTVNSNKMFVFFLKVTQNSKPNSHTPSVVCLHLD